MQRGKIVEMCTLLMSSLGREEQVMAVVELAFALGGKEYFGGGLEGSTFTSCGSAAQVQLELWPKEVGVKAPETAPVTPSGKVIAQVGHKCICDGCKKVVYRVVKPVYDGLMRVSDLIASFEPVGHSTRLNKDMDIFVDQDGNVATNCPLCHGSLTLWLVGEGGKDNGQEIQGGPTV